VDWFAALMQRAVTAYPKSYPVNAPQDTAFPYATLQDITELRPQTLTDWDLEFARIQIDTWAESVAEARTAMETLIAALVTGDDSNGHTFQRADIALGPRDVGGEKQGDTIIYRRSADLMIPHS
jgi:hypothetical protein